jgi:predicted RNA-binding Zn ribbon-like protein
LNSIATPLDMPVDWLDDGDGFLSWLAQARLVPTEALNAFREQETKGELDRVADEARELREWFRGFVRKHMGRSLTPEAIRELDPLNKLLARDEAFGRISIDRHGGRDRLELRMLRRWRSPESLLTPIGEALARLVCDEDFANIKACEGHVCTLMFADHTRRRARRWCSMAVCGNRAKQTAYRNRLKESA